MAVSKIPCDMLGNNLSKILVLINTNKIGRSVDEKLIIFTNIEMSNILAFFFIGTTNDICDPYCNKTNISEPSSVYIEFYQSCRV